MSLNHGKSRCLAYADDIAIITHSMSHLHQVIDTVENWSINNGIDINKSKSAVLIVRVDKVTPQSYTSPNIRGFPVKQ